LGAVVIAIAGATLIVGLATPARPSTMAGPATGLCLVVAGILTIAGWTALGQMSDSMA
jgi:hypothetical protein